MPTLATPDDEDGLRTVVRRGVNPGRHRLRALQARRARPQAVRCCASRLAASNVKMFLQRALLLYDAS